MYVPNSYSNINDDGRKKLLLICIFKKYLSSLMFTATRNCIFQYYSKRKKTPKSMVYTKTRDTVERLISYFIEVYCSLLLENIFRDFKF